ncbi:hypothetical protein H6P81_014870 [Aristolochia fimbriata]|uniref:Uncharacterized protein n=1 Tax=Aristolochia fimbriata TaxID=158543 RepID=A0AAV7E5W4_ARIFI|nr:hypothetical protein H6P81_014870 [Aristolochia fimbriata]
MGREIREAVAEGMGSFQNILLMGFHGAKQIAGEHLYSGQEQDGNFVVQKWHQFLLLLHNAAVFLAEKLEHVLPHGARSETLHHWLVAVFLVLFAAGILLIAVPVLLCFLKCFLLCFINLVRGVVVAVVSVLASICGCFADVVRELGMLIYSLVKGVVLCFKRCFPRLFSRGGRMMRAPGRPGQWISRPGFESNPADYFRTLHAKV